MRRMMAAVVLAAVCAFGAGCNARALHAVGAVAAITTLVAASAIQDEALRYPVVAPHHCEHPHCYLDRSWNYGAAGYWYCPNTH